METSKAVQIGALGIEMAEIDPRVLVPSDANREIDQTDTEFVDFVADIKQKGVLQPLLVTKNLDVLAGHRRRLAAIAAGLAKVPVIFRELKAGETVYDIFLSENQHRRDLTLLEEAAALKRIQDEEELGVRDLARRVNRSFELVRSLLRILELDAKIQEYFHKNLLPVGLIPALYKLIHFKEEQLKLANLYIAGKLTRIDFEKSVDNFIGKADHETSPEKDRRVIGSSSGIKTRKGQPRILETNSRRVSRVETTAKLLANGSRRISLHAIKQVLESACCYCGRTDEANLCATCPMLMFANGIIGRAETDAGDPEFDEDF